MTDSPELKDYFQQLKQQQFTWFIIIVSCIPYLVLRNNGLAAIAGWFMPVTLPELFQPFSLWKVWTPTFVHYTVLHLVTNLYLWWLFASKIEAVSRTQLVVVFFISAVVGNLSQWWVVGEKFGGLSGVVYALLGYLWVLKQYTGNKQYDFDTILGWLLIFAIPVAATGVLGKFANYAHLGGLLCGVLLAMVYIRATYKLDKKEEQ